MTKKQAIQLFEERKVRTVWDDEQEKWYFSIVDVCGVLTDQPDNDHARNYWKVLKHRLKKEGNETVTNCNQMKLRAYDGKMRPTDVLCQSQRLSAARKHRRRTKIKAKPPSSSHISKQKKLHDIINKPAPIDAGFLFV